MAMAADLAGRRLLVAGDPRAAAAVADRAASCAAVVALANDTRGVTGTAIQGHGIPFDGWSEAGVDRAVDTALDRLERLDGVILVVETAPMPPLDADGAFWERCITQPLRTAFWLVRRSVDEWLASDHGGSIVMLVESGSGDGGTRSACIVESALRSLARSVAKEYGRRAITCNVVTAGSAPGERRAAVDAALFLVSPAAGFVTGECLRVTDDTTERDRP
jgi:NAD(P)-dependent dehydrogenase (short-subunit alcohol dehydrogenase family)